ncbi:Glucose-1-phosphate adenylyltransferase large subunit 1, chloroplastic/amyloplastic [Clarias magur]|uniref:Glucose-1-phosphate adenylyltransferase large subunit 1, chloroplastic/amyloplastic n=1 Tax=Clarias magur TaxID=1594786 RepID=A0A8J4URA0_CLAMG|nr:Glucose-1-phosphate adenylyltransferase large subunit 1, chloroplastic/amyloplastic [Clarias magur]
MDDRQGEMISLHNNGACEWHILSIGSPLGEEHEKAARSVCSGGAHTHAQAELALDPPLG